MEVVKTPAVPSSGAGSRPETNPMVDPLDQSQASFTKKLRWGAMIPFILVHLACLFALVVGVSWAAVIACVAFYFIRMFAVTGIYHRYFSHRTYKTSRVGQFLLALFGSTTVQRGPLWWAAHHRKHHRFSDTEADIHSPVKHGFWWSHVLWIFADGAEETDLHAIRDLAKFPELRLINKYDTVVPVLFAVAVFGFGVFLEAFFPALGTNGWQMLIWGFFISTVFLFHGTYTVNSLAHLIGRRRFATRDDSRNNLFIALITMGEGWHNNHHHYQASARQGFYWWEIDVTFYILKVLSWTGFIWDLRPVPAAILDRGRN